MVKGRKEILGERLREAQVKEKRKRWSIPGEKTDKSLSLSQV